MRRGERERNNMWVYQEPLGESGTNIGEMANEMRRSFVYRDIIIIKGSSGILAFQITRPETIEIFSETNVQQSRSTGSEIWISIRRLRSNGLGPVIAVWIGGGLQLSTRVQEGTGGFDGTEYSSIP